MTARRFALAAAAVCLVAAAPALSRTKNAPRPVPITALPADPAPSAAPAVEAGRARMFEEGMRQDIVQALPMGIEAGVGIFSVLGVHQRRRDAMRTDPMRDLLPRQKKVAAVGLRMSF